ncbi:hypothetical protein N752_01170 [Desulforamulus aquiferis]|nr:type II secretion system F family protein [Desulforamulus aquiferis]RYD07226.1 hypothetical protein N752_01170 [Desulforamulus aquiferis]
MDIYMKFGILCGFIPLFYFSYLISHKREKQKQLEEYMQLNNPNFQEKKDKNKLKDLVLKLIQPIMPSKVVLERMQINLLRANLNRFTAEEVYLFRWATAFITVVIMFTLFFPDIELMLFFGGSAGMLFYLLPPFLIKRKIITRQKKAQREVLDFIDLVANSIEAGLELTNAIDKVTREIPGVLSEEFQIAFSEVALNRRRAEAFKSLAERLDVEDITLLVDAINQADQTGVPMAKVLKDQATRIRQKYKTNALRMAQAATIKMLAPLFLFILPALIIVVLGPPAIGISQQLAF